MAEAERVAEAEKCWRMLTDVQAELRRSMGCGGLSGSILGCSGLSGMQ